METNLNSTNYKTELFISKVLLQLIKKDIETIKKGIKNENK